MIEVDRLTPVFCICSSLTGTLWERYTFPDRYEAAGAHLAHDVAEGPKTQAHGGHDKRDPDEEGKVRHGQVEDVQISHGLHLGVPQDDVDDERIAHEAYQEHRAVESLFFIIKRDQSNLLVFTHGPEKLYISTRRDDGSLYSSSITNLWGERERRTEP